MEIIDCFLNEPTRHWRFRDIKAQNPLADINIAKKLTKLQQDGLIIKHTPPHHHPYYTGDNDSPRYRAFKQMHGFQLLHDSGLIAALISLKAQTVIIFGSFSRWDWNIHSDVDLFIVGEPFDPYPFERKLDRTIHLFHFNTVQELKQLSDDLLANIISGTFIQGDIHYLDVKLNETQRGIRPLPSRRPIIQDNT